MDGMQRLDLLCPQEENRLEGRQTTTEETGWEVFWFPHQNQERPGQKIQGREEKKTEKEEQIEKNQKEETRKSPIEYNNKGIIIIITGLKE